MSKGKNSKKKMSMEKMSKRWEDVALGYEGKYFIFVQYRKKYIDDEN